MPRDGDRRSRRELLRRAGLLGLGMWAGPLAGLRSARAARVDEPEPVVVELFTSEGCSSCPPADALLREIGREPGILAFSFHVDYWNRLGWRDPFSDRAWSARQEAYARRLRSTNVYTPQMVVDGRFDVVGSDEREVRRVVGKARAERRRREWTRLAVSARFEDGAVSATAAPPDGGSSDERGEVLVVLLESGLEVAVERGENARRTLRHDFVARQGARVKPGETARLVPPDSITSGNRSRWSVGALWEDGALRLLGAGRAPIEFA